VSFLQVNVNMFVPASYVVLSASHLILQNSRTLYGVVGNSTLQTVWNNHICGQCGDMFYRSHLHYKTHPAKISKIADSLHINISGGSLKLDDIIVSFYVF
jgi:hypothetical protein